MSLRRLAVIVAVGTALGGGAARAQEWQELPLLPPAPVESIAAPAPLSVFAPPAIGDFESLLPPAESSAGAALETPPLAAAVASPPLWYYPSYWLGPDPWTAGVELGISGSEGINNVFSLRTGGHLKRETKRWKLDSSLVYNKNHSNGVETQNNGKLDARLDRILAESRWTLFILENMIYDEFQAYDVQLSLNSGLGYRLVDTEVVDLMARAGAGSTREFGGINDQWTPQALFGVDYEHKITKMQRLVGKVDYFPEWEDFRNYRVVSDLGWQIQLDRPKNMSVKFSFIDRYDSTPDGVKPNNFDYAVLLIWGL